jgi:4'-phosphopantetheinyl transferase
MSLAKQLVITRNAYGKPDLQWPPCSNDTNNIHNKRLRFNVAHTCGLIGIAITSDRLIGLDIETAGRRTRHNPDTVARRRFSTMEYGNLNALLTDEEKAAYFIRLWTLKEAYVKAVGRGISAAPGLKSFSFSVEEGEDGGGGGKIRFSSVYPERIQWEFALLRPSDRHIAALCVQKTRNGGMPVSIKSFSMGVGVEGEGEETVVMTTVPLLARGHSD